MGRPKRAKPYNPAAPIHDRRATSSNKGVQNHLQPDEIEDPFERGAIIVVMRQKRGDPLGALKVRRHISAAQYEAGRAFQDDFETIESPAQAVDPSKPYVDCSRNPQPLSGSFSRALMRLNHANRELGMIGSAIAHDVLVAGKGYDEIAADRGYSGERWEKYFGLRFREALDTLAICYGFAMEKR